jgi:hypothetical protein
MENCSSSAERLLLGTGEDGCFSGTVMGNLSRRVGPRYWLNSFPSNVSVI